MMTDEQETRDKIGTAREVCVLLALFGTVTVLILLSSLAVNQLLP